MHRQEAISTGLTPGCAAPYWQLPLNLALGGVLTDIQCYVWFLPCLVSNALSFGFHTSVSPFANLDIFSIFPVYF